MKTLLIRMTAIVAVAFTVFALVGGGTQETVAASPPSGVIGRYLVMVNTAGDYNAVRSSAVSSGATVVRDLRNARAIAISADSTVAASLARSSRVKGVAKDGVRSLIQPDGTAFNAHPAGLNHQQVSGPVNTTIVPGPQDPASSFPGLMWNLDRIHVPEAHSITTGDPSVKVGIADTGLDFTHSELDGKIVDSQSFVDVTLCEDYFGFSDDDWSNLVVGNSSLAGNDWNGHGSWIGGNIAARMDGVGINGIAPSVGLVALKISDWCGSAYDSSIIDAMLYAANTGIDVVNISFGGYLNITNADEALIYNMYVTTVAYAKLKGTLIVSSAGNDHVRLGTGGRVLSHGMLAVPGGGLTDLFGYFETPAGIPGVIAVSATGNINGTPSASCPVGTFESSDATCKPNSDLHKPFGYGAKDQLTYYSNYGPRIDVAAPGGARKFNVPSADRGGTGGFPYTLADGATAFEIFSITSNTALEIPCFTLTGPFYADECYTSIQGTSMAGPHVAGVAALLIAPIRTCGTTWRPSPRSSRPAHAPRPSITTTPLSATDLSIGDRTGLLCPTGFCHLGGAPVSNAEAYGAGIIDALKAVQ